jgi:hypothetical protein
LALEIPLSAALILASPVPGVKAPGDAAKGRDTMLSAKTIRAAGACLAASEHRGADHLIVVVLGSTNGDGRYEDARKLFDWAWEQQRRKIEEPEETKKEQPQRGVYLPFFSMATLKWIISASENALICCWRRRIEWF